MNQTALVALHNCQNAIDTINQILGMWVPILQSHQAPMRFQHTVHRVANDGRMAVEYMGHQLVEASPRVVFLSAGSAAIEWRFAVDDPFEKDKKDELYRFYLLNSGRLTDSFANANGFGDIQDRFASEEICGSVIAGAFRSPQFQPAPQCARSIPGP